MQFLYRFQTVTAPPGISPTAALGSRSVFSEQKLFLFRFEVLTGVTKKNAVFLDVTQCCSCKNRSFGGTYRLHHQGGENQRAIFQLLVTGYIIPSSLILSTLMLEAIHPSESRFVQELHGITSQKAAYFTRYSYAPLTLTVN
jgi:hypothetical protein